MRVTKSHWLLEQQLDFCSKPFCNLLPHQFLIFILYLTFISLMPALFYTFAICHSLYTMKGKEVRSGQNIQTGNIVMGIKRSLCKVGICINKERFLLHNEDKCASQ